MATTPNEWLTREEAAQYARVSTRTIDRWCKSGALRRRRAGRRVLISRHGLNRMIVEQSEDDPAPPTTATGPLLPAA